jgi:hypothetical protein
VREQCATIFGESYHDELAVTWVDSDNDTITCCSDAEFRECVREQLNVARSSAVRLALVDTGRNFRAGPPPQVLGFCHGPVLGDDASASSGRGALLQPANADAVSVAHEVPAVLASFFPAGKILPHAIPEFLQPAVRVLQRNPSTVDLDIDLAVLPRVLSAHAIHLLEQHQFVEARDLLGKLVAWKNDAVNWYNLACAHSLLADSENALIALKAAIDAGYSNLAHMLADDDLVNVRSHSQFPSIVNLMLAKDSSN